MRRRFLNPQNNKKNYLTFEAIEDSAFSFTQNTIQYSMDGTTWNDLTVGSSTPTVSAGSKIHFKTTNPSITSSKGMGTFSSTGKFNVSGNIMSMLYGDDFTGQSDLTGKDYVFSKLFQNCAGLVDASELILPATTLTSSCYNSTFNGCRNLASAPALPATTLATACYWGMFSNCTSLISTPELPATTMVNGCYYFMFLGCTSLVSAPSILPATTLAASCYFQMFKDCISLVNAPKLPATTLSSYCYCSMFSSCSNLNNITMLATDISATDCLSNWVEGVASTGTFYRNPEMASLPTGNSGIPEGWTVSNANVMP